jgi:hypothetical protein
LEKQPNFIFGLAGACEDKIQLRIQKRSHAAEEPIPGKELDSVPTRNGLLHNASIIGKTRVSRKSETYH